MSGIGFNFNLVEEGASVFVISTFILYAVMHIAFAAGVFYSARKGEVKGEDTWLVNPLFWSLSTLILGPFFAAVYWVIHHSSIGSFNQDNLKRAKEDREKIESFVRNDN
ncbi:hypothetical protein CWB97_21285 [Pseudoalteromonas citrea]|nr:hypothetical protein CWB97_21285 [Pseudoalteromonas citrea]